MNLNKVFIMGNLTRDPEKKALPSGQAVVNFGVASNRFYLDKNQQKQQEVEFHNVVAFGKTAEVIAQYLKKGSLILVEGRIKTRNWQDQAGVKHYMTEIITEKMQLGPRPGGAGTSEGSYQPSQKYNNQSPAPAAQQRAPRTAEPEIPVIEEGEQFSGFIEKDDGEINVSEIPF